jgi:dTDP-4-dehydrorhamnose 3,5-epimerase
MIQNFSFEKTKFNTVFLIKPFIAYDERGYLLKDYSAEEFGKYGIVHNLKEVFYTSSKKSVIRAIHFQRNKQQPKLVRCIKGQIYDVVVDLRKESSMVGQWEGFYLNEDNKEELLIPGGFGHGYLVLEDAIVSYKCAEKFYGEFDDGIMWNDETIQINWPLDRIGEIILSEKDNNLQTFKDYIAKE